MNRYIFRGSRVNRDRRDQAFARSVIAEATKRHNSGREPSCTLNHDVQRRELRDQKIQSRVCKSCGWILSPAKEEPESERCYWCDGLMDDDKHYPYCCRTCGIEAERDNYLD